MIRRVKTKDFQPIIEVAQRWIADCLVDDKSVFADEPLWTRENIAEVRRAFIENPDEGDDNFLTKLRGQLDQTTVPAKKLMAEMLWVLLLFPARMKLATKRQKISEIWSWTGEPLDQDIAALSDEALSGVGSAGTGYSTHRWREMAFLITLTEDLKRRQIEDRQRILSDYDSFAEWMSQVPRDGDRQFRHMLRYFCFPERVEPVSSNRERWAILAGFKKASEKEFSKWSDAELDNAIFDLRKELAERYGDEELSFYQAPLVEFWRSEKVVANRLLAVYVGQASQTNLEHGLKQGTWGFKQTAKPKGFDKLKIGDFILLASGFSGGSPRVTNDTWTTGRVEKIWLGQIAGSPFQSTDVEWPDEPDLALDKRYQWRIRFDPQSVRIWSSVNLGDEEILSSQLSEALRNSASANGKGYVLPATSFLPLELDGLEPPIETELPPTELSIGEFGDAAVQAALDALQATNFRVERAFLNRFVASLAAKPFLILTGNSGTGKTKLAELLVRWLCRETSDQFAIVPVGADWTDNRNVLGFVNHLRLARVKDGGAETDLPIYQSTKILDLLLDASRNENARKPYFLILDEMNLSHVERYFADFLSTMESNDGRLLLHRERCLLPRKLGGPCDVPETLVLPKNTFVIGTVNVDETTYMFSPKVLDRANVIEFRVGADVPAEFLKSGGRGIGNISSAPTGYAEGFLRLSFRARGLDDPALALNAAPDQNLDDAAQSRIESCRTTVADLFAIMQARHQEFAFRSMTEILRFLAVSYELKSADQDWNWTAAMDAQILQKILPKLHGSKRKIGSLLAALATYCDEGNRSEAEKMLIDETKAEAFLAAADKRANAPMFQGTYVKLCEMMDAIRRDQFVSFIQ